ncbi:MAG: hypothetical protein AAGF25_09805, partial [Pseudomonadota bacterium]
EVNVNKENKIKWLGVSMTSYEKAKICLPGAPFFFPQFLSKRPRQLSNVPGIVSYAAIQLLFLTSIEPNAGLSAPYLQ